MSRLVWLEGRDGPVAINPDQVRAVQRAPESCHLSDLGTPHAVIDVGNSDEEGEPRPYVIRGTPAHVVNMLRGTGERKAPDERWTSTPEALEDEGLLGAMNHLLKAYDRWEAEPDGGSIVIEFRR